MAVAYYNYLFSIYEERERRKIQRNRIRDRCDPFDMGDREFQRLWRITKEMALYVVERLRVDLETHGKGLPVHIKVLSAIKFLANGGYQKQIGQEHSLCQSQTTVSTILSQFLKSIYKRLFREWVHFPGIESARRQVAAGFEESSGVPGILGLVDSTHIRIFCPRGPQRDQFKSGRNDAYTIKVQLVTDANQKIIHVNAKYPGSQHDSFIWNHSIVRKEMKRLYDEKSGQYFLLGDSGYPLEPWLMTPIANAEPDSCEEKYNEWHTQMLNVVERTNRHLRGTLRCLGHNRILHYSPEKASEIVYACCIIYNLMKHFGIEMQTDNNEPYEDEQPDVEQFESLLDHAQEFRTHLVNTYFST